MEIRAVKLLSLSFIFLLIINSVMAVPAAAEATPHNSDETNRLFIDFWNPAEWFRWLRDQIQDFILSIPQAVVDVFVNVFEFIEGTIYDMEGWVVESFDGHYYAEAVALPVAMTVVMSGLFLLVYAIIWLIGAVPIL